MTGREQLRLSFLLCMPAILAQFSTILMEYIDAGMVGRLGAEQAAAIGLVSSTSWIFGGFCTASSSGFTVQVAQRIGANDFVGARSVLRKSFTSLLLFSSCLALLGVAISGSLPRWLGGGEELWNDASAYFAIHMAFLPMMQLCYTTGMMLEAAGNMKVPSFCNVLMCLMDVGFNYLFIYGLGMGVKGAAIGTGLSHLLTALVMLWFLLERSPELSLHLDRREVATPRDRSFLPDEDTLQTAFGICGPMWMQNIVMRGAYIISTLIVAPLGTIAIAANSFAIIAESFCYMPGYGMEEAVTTLVGQSVGARRKDLARRFAHIATAAGALMMTGLAVLMYAFAPQMMGLLTNDAEVIALGARILRIEAFAELLFGVSIVAYGACVGAGDTLMPSVMNFASMWVVRIGLALVLTPRFGLVGYWVAMCIELNVRGLLFMGRISGHKWLEKDILNKEKRTIWKRQKKSV
ncbi:MAG: MATE family efflux transporter [Bacteroidales bacterium]|nr:MATE family efflux transporter [Bacteroidales bacterium]